MGFRNGGVRLTNPPPQSDNTPVPRKADNEQKSRKNTRSKQETKGGATRRCASPPRTTTAPTPCAPLPPSKPTATTPRDQHVAVGRKCRPVKERAVAFEVGDFLPRGKVP